LACTTASSAAFWLPPTINKLAKANRIASAGTTAKCADLAGTDHFGHRRRARRRSPETGAGIRADALIPRVSAENATDLKKKCLEELIS
jgi:hypothetical protein